MKKAKARSPKTVQVKKKRKVLSYPRRAADAFVTQKMLYKVRDELKAHMASEIHGVKSDIHGFKAVAHGLKSDIESVRSEVHGLRSEFEDLKSEVHSLRSEIESVRSEVHAVKAEIEELRSEVHALKAVVEGVKSEVQALRADVHRIALLVEEQNNRNKIVLDGLSHLFGRQERLETQFLEFKK